MLVKTMLNNVGNKQGLIQLSEKQNIELKNRLLEMCTDVMEFCETNGLTCVLGGGTALGAVRHEMFDVIGSLLPQQRTRYGTGYSKTDFSVLDKTYEDYKGGKM